VEYINANSADSWICLCGNTPFKEGFFPSPITVSVAGTATHPEDDLILATALSVGVDYLVTGDSKLQRLRSYQGVTILSPRAFLEALTAGPGDDRDDQEQENS
jgi:hypothetical protein